MRATRAYIASLGTTGLLLAFAGSLLIVVSTLFAFNAWPGADLGDAVDSLVVDDNERPFHVAGPEQVALDAAPAAVAVAAVPVGGGTAVIPATGTPAAAGGTGGPAGAPGAGNLGGGGITGTNGGTGPSGTQPPGGDELIDTSAGADQVADTTEQTTQDLGDTVSGVDPQLGQTVSDTGQALSDLVRDLPDVQAGPGGVKIGN